MGRNAKATESVLHPNSNKSNSLRTTIPKFIIDQLKLDSGDKVDWSIHGNGEGAWLKVKIVENNGG